MFLNAAAEVYRRCDMPSRALSCLKRCHEAWGKHMDDHNFELYVFALLGVTLSHYTHTNALKVLPFKC
jgi:hypothetical protein